MKKIFTALSLTVLTFTSSAQAENIVMPDGVPVEVVNEGKLGPSSAATDAPSSVNANANENAALLSLLQQQQEQAQRLAASNVPSQEEAPTPEDVWSQRVKGKYKPTLRMTVRPSGNVTVAGSMGIMNRIETNFGTVSAKTSDEKAIIETDGNVVYVTVNRQDPVGLILSEEGVPESAVNVTLVPEKDLPPAMVNINIPLSASMRIRADEFQNKLRMDEITKKANEEEDEIKRSDRHTERLKEILKTTALGQVPAGFTMALEEMPSMSYSYRHPCMFGGIYAETKQRMIGANELIDVVLVKNETTKPYILKEESCLSQDSLAIAILDKATLNSGEKTEVYIIRDRNWAKDLEKSQTRPRLDE